MAAADVTYLYFRRDRDSGRDDPPPTVRTTRGGGGLRGGSVPPVSLRAGSVPPPRSVRAGSVTPAARGATGSASSTSAHTHTRRAGSVAPQTFHRVTSGGALTESSFVTSPSAGRGVSGGHSSAGSGSVSRAGAEVDRRRRASLATSSLSPSELQHRSRTARESLIYRADDFQSGSRPGHGFIPLPPRPINGPLSVSVRQHGRRASVSAPSSADHRITTTVTSRGGSDDVKQLNGLGSSSKSFTIEHSTVPPPSKESLTGLRSRMNSAREQMSRHKLLLDRYLPYSNGPTNDVQYDVEYKVSELAERMPELDPTKRPLRTYRDSDISTKPVLLVTPYTPLPRVQKVEYSALPPVRSSFTPKISDVRKRARSVLCKVKGDPRYFDF